MVFTKPEMLEGLSVTQQYFALGLALPKKGLDSPEVCVHNRHSDGSEC